MILQIAKWPGLLIPLMICLTGCDWGFFADIKDGISNQPVSGAKATYSFNDGGSEQYATSNDQGRISFMVGATVWIDPPPLCGTLTVEKDGYQTWSTQFSGKWPETPYTIYLFPVLSKPKPVPADSTLYDTK